MNVKTFLLILINRIKLVKLFLSAIANGQNNFFFSFLPGLYSGDPLDIPWVNFCLRIVACCTNGKSKVSLIEIKSIRGIIKVFFYTLSNKGIFFLCQINHLACCVTESNYHNKQSYTSTDECLNLRFSLNIKGRYFLGKRVKTANVIICVPNLTLSCTTFLIFVLNNSFAITTLSVSIGKSRHLNFFITS